MEIQNFSTEFVRRTKEILQEYSGKRDMTLLLNCTLGLIVLPYEKGQLSNRSPWNKHIDELSELKGLKIIKFEPKRDGKDLNKDFYTLLEKIRHGIAHQHITPKNENNECVGVTIKNLVGGRIGRCDLEVYISQEDLKAFALFVADSYLTGK